MIYAPSLDIRIEDERGLLKYNVKQSFFPFSGKTPEQITLLMGTANVTAFTKCFYANFGNIFDTVEMEQAEKGLDFYVMARPRQLTLIEENVNKILGTIESENPEPQMETINDTNNQDDTNGL